MPTKANVLLVRVSPLSQWTFFNESNVDLSWVVCLFVSFFFSFFPYVRSFSGLKSQIEAKSKSRTQPALHKSLSFVAFSRRFNACHQKLGGFKFKLLSVFPSHEGTAQEHYHLLLIKHLFTSKYLPAQGILALFSCSPSTQCTSG